MTKFIKLTECDGQVLILNIDRIEHICLGAKGTDTYIKMLKNSSDKESYFFVKEKLEDIWLMLRIDNSKAPVMMTAVEALEYYKK